MSRKKNKTIDINRHVDVIAILKALQDHVINGREMTSSQVNAALALLKRAMPEQESDGSALSLEEALKALNKKK